MIVNEFHSYLIAQVMGLYLVFMSIIMMARASYFKEVIANLHSKDPALMVFSSFGLMLGIFLICVHNRWVWQPDIFVTIIAWIVFVKSLLWLVFSDGMLNMIKKHYHGATYYIGCVISLVYGVILLSRGFYVFYYTGAIW